MLAKQSPSDLYILGSPCAASRVRTKSRGYVTIVAAIPATLPPANFRIRTALSEGKREVEVGGNAEAMHSNQGGRALERWYLDNEAQISL